MNIKQLIQSTREAYDRRIIELLKANPTLNSKEIAALAGTSALAVYKAAKQNGLSRRPGRPNKLIENK